MEPAIAKDQPDVLRVDAARNRARVTAAAKEAFADLGADVPMVEIARRAGVGAATLYRRFPTRDDLFELVFEDRIEDCATTVDRFLALATTDPWAAFAGFIEEMFGIQRENRAFNAALLHAFPEGGRLEQERQRALTGLGRLVALAKKARVIRSDFEVGDIELLLKAHDGVLVQAEPGSQESSRLATLLLDACRPPDTRHGS